MNATTVAISLRRPLVESHANREDAMWHAALVISAVDGKVPISVIGPDGEYAFVYTPPKIFARQTAAVLLRPGAPITGVPAVRHYRDEDCTVDPKTGCCIQCGVDHSTICGQCGGMGFHRAGCSEVA